MRIGYHYTTKENWEKIQKEGLKKRKIENVSVSSLMGDSVYGIWIWEKDFSGRFHIGNILGAAARGGSLKVVKLKVKYSILDLLYKGMQKVAIKPEGELGKLCLYEDETAFILQNDIPPEKIELIGEYNLDEVFI